MTAKSNITQERLSQLFDYDPETGLFIWKQRPLSDFANLRAMNSWNARYSGMVAGGTDTHGYVQIKINRHLFLAHQLAWLFIHGKWPNSVIDHINNNRKDNRIINLREATLNGNATNSKTRKDNTSGMKGVSFHKRIKKWQAQISCKRKYISLGYYDTPEEAYAAYCKAAADLHGDFSRVA